MLDEAQSTLEHWEEEYERYERKQDLIAKKERLEREYAWAKWWKQKERVEKLDMKVRKRKEELEEINRDLERTEKKEKESKGDLDRLEYELDDLYRDLVHHEGFPQNS